MVVDGFLENNALFRFQYATHEITIEVFDRYFTIVNLSIPKRPSEFASYRWERRRICIQILNAIDKYFTRLVVELSALAREASVTVKSCEINNCSLMLFSMLD